MCRYRPRSIFRHDHIWSWTLSRPPPPSARNLVAGPCSLPRPQGCSALRCGATRRPSPAWPSRVMGPGPRSQEGGDWLAAAPRLIHCCVFVASGSSLHPLSARGACRGAFTDVSHIPLFTLRIEMSVFIPSLRRPMFLSRRFRGQRTPGSVPVHMIADHGTCRVGGGGRLTHWTPIGQESARDSRRLGIH